MSDGNTVLPVKIRLSIDTSGIAGQMQAELDKVRMPQPGGAGAGAGTAYGIPQIKLPPGVMNQFKDLNRALLAGQALADRNVKTFIAGKKELTRGILAGQALEEKNIKAKAKADKEELTRINIAGAKRLALHRSIYDGNVKLRTEIAAHGEMQRKQSEARYNDLLKAEALQKRMADRKAKQDRIDEATRRRQDSMTGKTGRGYGSEGMFAAGTSPIMQGLAWQSLFMSSPLLGPMSFAPMAMYQNFSLRRQRMNRGFNTGAGTGLSQALGGENWASAAHAMAAIDKTGLSPQEKERHRQTIDIMAAGRIRGGVSRKLDAWESGIGPAGGIGKAVGALGGVASVALGASMGLAAVGFAAANLNAKAAELARSLAEAANEAGSARRGANLGRADTTFAGLGSSGAMMSILAAKGVAGANIPPRLLAPVAKMLQRGADAGFVEEAVSMALSAERGGTGVSAQDSLSALVRMNPKLSGQTPIRAFTRGAAGLMRSGDIGMTQRAEYLDSLSNPYIPSGYGQSIQGAVYRAQGREAAIGGIQGRRYAGDLSLGSERAMEESRSPGALAVEELRYASEMKIKALTAESEATWRLISALKDASIFIGGSGSAGYQARRESQRRDAIQLAPMVTE